MTDKEHSKKIHDAANALNIAIYEAFEAGLRIEIETRDRNYVSRRQPMPTIETTISRIL